MAQEIGSAKAIQGQVTATGPEGARSLSVGSPVFKGDTLATAKGAGGSIQFLDKTVLNVGEGSKVSLDQYVYDGGKGSGQALFKMAQGTFRAVTGEIVKQNPESFKMQSPLATIGIRGTETAHTVPGPDQPNGSESHLVMVFDGKPVIVQPLGGGAYQVLSQAGVKVEVGKFGAGPVMVMTPQEYKYYQALTETGLQQGVPQDTLTPQGGQGQKDPTVKAAQDAANRATAEAQAKAAEAAAAKAAAEAAAKAAAEAAASGDPQAKAAADAAAKAAAEAAAKAEAAAQAAADAAAKAQAEAFAAQQALALVEAAKAAAQAAADAATQGNQLTLTPGSIISFSTSTDAFGNTTTIVTVTPPTGGQGSGAPAPIIISDQAEKPQPDHQDDDTVDGGDSTPVVTTLNLSGSVHAMLVDLASQQPKMVDLTTSEQTLLASTIVNVIGSAYNDSIMGNASANNLQGGDGNDSISGGDGNDTLIGGAGNDMLDGEDGTDSLVGGLGDDMLDGGDSGDILDAGTGQDSVDGGDGNDAIFMGTALNDTDGQDSIDGGGGHDVLYFTDNGEETDDLDSTKNVEEIVLGNATTSIEFPADYSEANWTAIGNVFEVDGAAIASTAGTSGNTLYFDGSSATLDGSFLVTGGGGNDTITGGGGNDTFYGGGGNDSLAGGEGDDSLTGGAGADTLMGDGGDDTFIGGAGNDSLEGGDGSDSLTGGAGADTLMGDGGDDTFVFNTGDVVSGEYVHGGKGNTTLKLLGNADFKLGGDSNPMITGLEVGATHTIELAAGVTGKFNWDSFSTLATQNVYVVGTEAGSETVEIHAFGDGNTLRPDVFVNDQGFDANDHLRFVGSGETNPDILDFSGYSDDHSLDVNMATGVVQYELGSSPQITFSAIDEVIGGGGDDTFTGGLTEQTLDGGEHGGEGNTISYASTAVGVTINLADGYASDDTLTDTLENFQNAVGGCGNDSIIGNGEANSLEGSAGDDTLQGGDGNDSLEGGDGEDSLEGGAGDDNLQGGEGNDLLFGGAGNDNISGGGGIDTVSYEDATAMRQIDLGGGRASDSGGTKEDDLSGIENAIGSAFGDKIYGNYGTNVIEGLAGNDTLDGFTDSENGVGDTVSYEHSTGAVSVNLAGGTASDGFGGTDTLINFQHILGSAYGDTLTGDADDNKIEGGEGDDSISGGTGLDNIDGGADADTIDMGANLNDTDGLDAIQGGAGEDVLRFTDNGAGTGDLNTTKGVESVMLGDALTSISFPGAATFTAADWTAIGGVLSIDGTEVGASSAATLTFNGSAAGAHGSFAVQGGQNDDTLTGGAGNDTLQGGEGEDSLEGGAGDDALVGGASSDILIGGDGTDAVDYFLEGGFGTVRIYTDGSVAVDDTLESHDTISGVEKFILNDVDYSSGVAGGNSLTDDVLGAISGSTTFTIDASHLSGTNVLVQDASAVTSAFNLVLVGGMGEDTNSGGLGDVLTGGAGNDTLEGLAGDDTFTGGGGLDVLTYAHDAATVYVNLSTDGVGAYDLSANSAHDGFGGTDSIDQGIHHVIGSAYDDHFWGSASADTLEGAAGDDSISGGGGNDSLVGGDGDDYLTGGLGNDTLVGGAGHDAADFSDATAALTIALINGGATVSAAGLGTDVLIGIENLIGSAFNDTLTGDQYDNLFAGGAGDDLLTGGAGSDTADYSAATAALSITLVNGGATVSAAGLGTDVLSGIENLIGSAFDDTLTGDSNDNSFTGGDGADQLHGGDGTDTLDYSQETGEVSVFISYGSEYFVTDSYGCADMVSSIERLVLNDADHSSTFSDSSALQNDMLSQFLGGSSGSFTLDGSNLTGEHSLNADGSGIDSSYSLNLIGGAGADSLVGGSGDDVIFGNGGADTLIGGNGSDIFWFTSTGSGADLADFTSGVDQLCFYAGSGDFSAMASEWFFDLGHEGNYSTNKATLLFDTDDQTLYYDADGYGTAYAQTVVATFNNDTLAQTDITVTQTPITV